MGKGALSTDGFLNSDERRAASEEWEVIDRTGVASGLAIVASFFLVLGLAGYGAFQLIEAAIRG